ncbi:hypothetical protein GH975_02260 [Litorivicinus lipolyticus]|uniref:Uncharacterized protein n=1 Tax=Litorivicinus lipolyticus TaxID=418701 RepID=A0A5Q2QB14_9GAMM|nr:hypothetical protein [Litorivicinus lipolyticus]QGG79452.1 hypothetical protein GH975_02260 [Litorivicinus lipolyticus]
MNDLQWLYWDEDSARVNPRKCRVMDVIRTLGLGPTQTEQTLLLQSGELVPWCKGELANRYAAMRLVRIHRVVVRNRPHLPARFQMGEWLSRPLLNGQSAFAVLCDPYFLEHRLERALLIISRLTGQSPKSTTGKAIAANVVLLTP